MTTTKAALIEAQAGLDGDSTNRHLARVADAVTSRYPAGLGLGNPGDVTAVTAIVEEAETVWKPSDLPTGEKS